MISVIRYKESAKDAWNACAASARNRFFVFQRGYMDYHRDRFEDHSLMFSNDGPPIGLLPATRDGDTLVSHGGLTFGGLLVSSECRLRQFREMIDQLVEYMRESGLTKFVYRAIPSIYQEVQGEEDLHVLEELGARVADTKVSCALKIGNASELRPSRRREIVKAKESGALVDRTSDVAPFMTMLEQCLNERHGAAPVHSPAEMVALQARFPENIQVWSSTLHNELVAGVILYQGEACTRIQYSASTETGRATSALDLVYGHLIQNKLPPGTWLDFGASMKPEDSLLNEPLMFYKESFGARTLLYRTYVLDVD